VLCSSEVTELATCCTLSEVTYSCKTAYILTVINRAEGRILEWYGKSKVVPMLK